MIEYPHTVTFQAYTKVSDGGGGYTQEWADFLTTEAFVCPVSADEVYRSQQTENPVNHSVFYPYQKGVKSDMRCYWVDEDIALELKGKPLDQGGQGEVMMVKCNG